MGSSLLILGGARSGKSRHAVAVQPRGGRVVFIATARPGDDEMAARIARHRAERPGHWTTIEAPLELAEAVGEALTSADAVVVDCVTLWVANLMARGDSEDAIVKAADSLAALAGGRDHGPGLTLVSNEVGEGVHPATAEGLRFRDILGRVNQRLAAACDRVALMVAGIPVAIKP
jgi:adenosylcobinamide kinase/adenosylcobinamide-phosphate guanylyltransferase